ncbi:carbonic anhydrase [Pseudomonas sp. S9]|uniref:carbonic anhydrase n=1 Tax=Pseudomonas sp. S9 TaxID=686578 RepID=UPI00025571FB|nr:carbonic anhydrase family protein [Pseudomonas sp. S9]
MLIKPTRLKLIAGVLAALPFYSVASEWSYSGHNAPDHWAMLDTNGGYATCAKGTHQSPIDIPSASATHINAASASLSFNYQRSPLDVVNNGHSIQTNVQGDNSLVLQGKTYQLLQFHFHSPSEHLYNGKHFPMEMHWVNQAADGSLLVVAAMIKSGESNTELEHIWSKMLPQKKGAQVQIGQAQAPDLSKILPSTSKHFFYQGSLTTPPCTEGVQWVLLEQPLQLSEGQISAFRHIFADNHRPAAAINQREIDED